MTTEKLLSFVSETVKNPNPMPPSIEELAKGISEADDSELDDAVDSLIHELASHKRLDRQRILMIVKENKQRMQIRLVEWLEDPQLKMRAAAGMAILSSYGIQSKFDPFADFATREDQIKKIKSLLPMTD